MNIRKVSLAFMAFAMAFSLSAYDFISGNLAYKINADGQSVTVTSLGSGNSQYGYPSSLTGNLKIPVAIAEGGKTYTVTAIDDYAFYNCPGLTNVKLPSSLKSIGNYAFYGCSGLTDVIIPASVEAIGNYTFYGCSSISSITVGKGVKRIGVSTFIGCAAITSVTWNVVDGSKMQSGLFTSSKITSLTIGDEVERLPLLFMNKQTELKSVVLPASLIYIGDSAFSGCSGLTNVTALGNAIKTISADAFAYCTSITSFVIPNSVNTIGASAFQGCTLLNNVSVGKSVSLIGSDVFKGCTALKKVTISDLAAWCNIEFLNEASNPIYYAHRIYLNNEEITELVVPDNVAMIRDRAFLWCYGLNSMSGGASLTSIGVDAFESCSSLQSVAIPNSVTTISDGAFNQCENLTSLTLGKSVTTIGESAFEYCEDLTQVTIPNAVTFIGARAFSNCYGLKKLDMGNSVKTIGARALRNCTALTRLTIPVSVTSLGDRAFYNCTGLTGIYSYPNPANVTLGDDVFYGVDKNIPLHVQSAYLFVYGEAAQWKSFLYIKGDLNFIRIGDVNDDNAVDISDVVAIANSVMGDVPTLFNRENADINGDGDVDITDVVNLANQVMGT